MEQIKWEKESGTVGEVTYTAIFEGLTLMAYRPHRDYNFQLTVLRDGKCITQSVGYTVKDSKSLLIKLANS